MNIFKNWFDKLRASPLERDHAGPMPKDHPIAPKLSWQRPDSVFVDSWYDGAVRTPANKLRIGPRINPSAIVVHTTDTMPGGFKAIVKSWTTIGGAGNAAHFMIGRTEADGMVQFVPIDRNANHAGGGTHGWWQVLGTKVHPNTMSIGIELDAGGKLLKLKDGSVIHPDTKKRVNYLDIYWDTNGVPWHRVTEYQLAILLELIRDLAPVLNYLPSTAYVVPNGDYKANQATLAKCNRNWLVGHWTLDPYNKSDPGPQVMELLNAFE